MKIAELWVHIGTKIDEFNKGVTDCEKAMIKVGKNLEQVGKNLTLKVTAPLVALGTIAVKVGADFEQAMMNAASVSGATADEMKLMEQVARDMGATTVFSARQAADAMYFMASAGWKAVDMAKAIKPTLDLAAATQSDLAFTTDTVVASLNQFQLGSAGAERLANVFAAAIAYSQATMEKLGISMTYVGPVFHSMGKSIEEAAAALMVLYNAGLDASMAGTSLRMGMVQLMDGTGDTVKALDRLGLSLKDVDPTARHLADIIDLLGQRGAKTKDIFDIFGVRAGPGFAAMIAQGGDALRDFEKQITGTDAAAKMAEMQINTLKGSLKLLTSALTEVAIQIFQILGPKIKDLVDNKIKPAVQWFSELSKGTKETVLIIGGLAAAMGPLLLIFGKLLTILPKIKLAMAALVSPVALVALGIAGLVKKIIDIDTGFKNLHKNWTQVERDLGRTVIWTEFARQAKIAGLNMDWFTARLIENKNDVIKTLDELAKGEIKHSDELRNLYLKMVKDKEEMLKKDKEFAENLEKINKRGIAIEEARSDAIRAQKTAYFALSGDLDGFIKRKEQELIILGKTDEEREKEITRLKKVNEGYGLVYTALNEANQALKNSKDLNREQREQLIATRDRLEAYIESLEKEGDAHETVIKKITAYKSVLGELAQEYVDGKISMTEYFEKWREHRKHVEETANDLQYLELAIEDFDQFVVEDTKDTFAEITKGLGIWTEEAQIAWERTRDEAKKAAEKTKEAWKNAFQTMAHVLQILADEVGGIFGGLISNIGLALDQIGSQFHELKEKGVGTFEAITKSIGSVLAGKIGGAIGQLVSGAKESFASIGSALGAALGSIIPGIGTVLGSAIGGLFGGLFKKGNKEAEEAAAAAKKLEHAVKALQGTLSRYGEISEETAKKIHESSKALGGFAAVSKHFADVIRDTGVTQENINDLWWRAGEILGHYQRGFLSASDAALAADESFSLLLEGAKKLGQEGSAAMVDFILKVRESGLEVQSVTDYVIAQLDRIPSSLTDLIAYHGQVGKSVEDMGGIAIQTFNAMLASGVSWLDAVEKMKEPLAALKERYQALGLQSDESLEKLFHIVGLTEKHADLFKAIEANKQIIEALGNSGWLTQEALQTLTGEATHYYRRLIEMGESSDDALRAMGPTLQKIFDYAQVYGLQVDKNTQSLIDQAMQLGVVKDKKAEEMAAQEKLFDRLADRIGEIMERVTDKIGGYFKTAFADAFDAAKNMAGDAATSINDTLKDISPIIKIGLKYDTAGLEGIGKFQHEGIAWRPQLAWIGERRPEAVVDIGKFRAGMSKLQGVLQGPRSTRESQTIVNLTINAQKLDDYTINSAAEKIFDAVERQKRRRGY